MDQIHANVIQDMYRMSSIRHCANHIVQADVRMGFAQDPISAFVTPALSKIVALKDDKFACQAIKKNMSLRS